MSEVRVCVHGGGAQVKKKDGRMIVCLCRLYIYNKRGK